MSEVLLVVVTLTAIVNTVSLAVAVIVWRRGR